MVILATLATIIASQALITGIFSLTQQGIQLGYIPRLTVQHTLSQSYWPDLRSSGQLGADVLDDCPCRRVRLLE